MSSPPYVCARCVMDTSALEIQFDECGACSFCRQYDRLVRERVFSGEEGRRRLDALVDTMKKEGADRDYDCVIGVSGGVDSTYTALMTKRYGLRPLAVHLDNGWDSELAVDNISRAISKLGIDLETYVIDWDEFRDLQLSFLMASTPDSEIPTDHAIVTVMHRTAARIGTRFVVTGYNRRTESHVPSSWSQGHYDWRYIKSIHRQFGTVPLKTFPRMNLWSYRRYLRTQVMVDLLDYVDYVKRDAVKVLERELGWRHYGAKHHESIYTRFYQGYMLPRKFGFDKRRCHLSSLVCSGEMTREEALEALKEEPYPLRLQMEDRAYVIKKLGLTEAEFEGLMSRPKKSYWDYPSYGRLFRDPLFNRLRAVYRSVSRTGASTRGGPTTLVLLTGSYPYQGAAEDSFIAPELRYLAASFDRVILVPERAEGGRLPLPPGIDVDETLAAGLRSLTRPMLVSCAAWAWKLIGREALERPTALTSREAWRRLAIFVARAEFTRRWIRDLLLREGIDAARCGVYTYWLTPGTLGAGLVKRVKRRLTVISRAHRYDLYEERQDPPYLPCRASLLRLVDKVFFISEHGKSYIVDRHAWAAPRCEVARLGVSGPKAAPPPSADGVFRIVSCSHITPVKRVELLLRGLIAAAARRPRQTFEWNHFGGPEGELQRAAAGAPANLVCRFTGSIPNHDVLAFYATHPVDVFMNTSESEGIPVSIMEAISHGIAVIATAVGGVPEIVSEDNGRLLGANPSVEEIAGAVLAALDAPDLVLAKRTASRALWQQLYDAERNYDSFAQATRGLIAEGRRSELPAVTRDAERTVRP